MSQPPLANDTPSRSTGAPGWRLDLIVALVVLLVSGTWATQFWKTWKGQGNEPEFYQSYFEPAVMVACGKGFVTSNPQPAALGDFLSRRRDSFDCRELPADLVVGREALVTEAWTYLQRTVGWSWRVLGISWSGMGPLFGLFFGAVNALVYAIARLGMGRVLAALCAIAIATSPLHLANLPHLRDYSKAPFTLALIVILGIMVTTPVSRRRLLALATAYGAVLGVGYGFRTDLLINLPLIVAVLFVFLPGRLTANLPLKAAATAVFVATFAMVSWPITSAVYQKGGCQWHVALLGMQSPFDGPLRIASAPYDFGYRYEDGFVIRGVQGFARRTQPEAPRPIYCSHEYDVQSGRQLLAIVLAFPADFVARAYASVIQVVELPFVDAGAPAAAWSWPVFSARQTLIQPLRSAGAWIAIAAVIVAAGTSVRLGFFLVFVLAYFGGYPAIQFQERHYFHLEFIGWWALGFLLQRAWMFLKAKKGERPVYPHSARLVWLRAATVVLPALIAFVGLMVGARAYQELGARRLFNAYLQAAKDRVPDPATRLTAIAAGDWPQYVEVDLDESACGPKPAVTFRYDPADADGDFTRTMVIDRRSAAAGPTRILLPVFESFTGLEFSDTRPGCVQGVYRFSDLRPFPLLLGATLPPDWESLPLYARLGR